MTAKSPAHKCCIEVLTLSLGEGLWNDLSPRARILWESPNDLEEQVVITDSRSRAAGVSEVWGEGGGN